MDKQITLSAFSDELANVRTKKKEFLAQIDHIIPWGEWIALIRPCYYKTNLRIILDSTIPLDYIIHHGSQMDAQATSTAGAEHIINGMVLVEIDLCENGFTITAELAVKFQRGAWKDPERLDLVMIPLGLP